jgi:hypothetical protein
MCSHCGFETEAASSEGEAFDKWNRNTMVLEAENATLRALEAKVREFCSFQGDRIDGINLSIQHDCPENSKDNCVNNAEWSCEECWLSHFDLEVNEDE